VEEYVWLSLIKYLCDCEEAWLHTLFRLLIELLKRLGHVCLLQMQYKCWYEISSLSWLGLFSYGNISGGVEEAISTRGGWLKPGYAAAMTASVIGLVPAGWPEAQKLREALAGSVSRYRRHTVTCRRRTLLRSSLYGWRPESSGANPVALQSQPAALCSLETFYLALQPAFITSHTACILTALIAGWLAVYLCNRNRESEAERNDSRLPAYYQEIWSCGGWNTLY